MTTRSRSFRLVSLLLLVWAVSGLLSSCDLEPGPITPPPLTSEPVTALPRANVSTGAWYTVYFTRPSYPERKENRSGGVDQALSADIDRAQYTIDAAVFDVRLPSVVDALVRAAKRRVTVRVVVDDDANGQAVEFADAIAQLEKGGVKVTRDERSALMHNKFIVIDHRVLWTGSMNLTPNDVYRNNNNMLRVELAPLVENYTKRFERLFEPDEADTPDKQVPNPRVKLSRGVVIENYFSPNGGAQPAILDRLKAARSDIRITAFTFTDSDMAKVLELKHKDGVSVRGVFETRNNGALGAEFANLKKAGLDILADGNCYALHSKLMIIDERTVIMGSYNFTQSANETNDENLLIIDDPALARAYLDEFERIYAQAKNPTRCGG